jgi:hypothetical protein
LALGLLTAGLSAAATSAADPAVKPKTAPNKVISVTVYPQGALVTREVAVPEGVGSFELVVTSLPPQTVNSSLYSEGSNGIQVLTTRYRQRPIKEDTREEVRKAEAQLKQLQNASQRIQSEMNVINQDLQMLGKLETFTGTTLKQLTDKGQLNGDTTITLAKYIMESRTEKADGLVNLQVQMQANQEQTQFVQRQLQELAAGSNKTERDAVIIVDKKDAGPGKVRLNYLVDSASWHPQYKFRAGKEKAKDAIQLEYLAAVVQQTGEEWGNVDLVLSTAQPMLNAAPPELKMLAVAVVPRGPGNAPPDFGRIAAGGRAGGQPGLPAAQIAAQMANAPAAISAPPGGAQPAATNPNEFLQQQALGLRVQAQNEYKGRNEKGGGEILNSAAAVEQTRELLVLTNEDIKNPQRPEAGGDGPSVTYHLKNKFTIPSRNDEQIIEVTRIDMEPEYFYKAVPILTPNVYRLANLTNTSKYVLLPGEATMYIGSDFVGRANLPLVAIGEQFTAGFGVDPQLQVQRQLVDKSRTMQGDNQVLKFEYRILVSSYKSEAVKLQLWDRLPHTDTEAVGVTLVKAKPEVSTDPLYARESRPHNLLRWDLDVAPAMAGEKALAVQYDFKLELGRQMQISNFAAK